VEHGGVPNGMPATTHTGGHARPSVHSRRLGAVRGNGGKRLDAAPAQQQQVRRIAAGRAWCQHRPRRCGHGAGRSCGWASLKGTLELSQCLHSTSLPPASGVLRTWQPSWAPARASACNRTLGCVCWFGTPPPRPGGTDACRESDAWSPRPLRVSFGGRCCADRGARDCLHTCPSAPRPALCGVRVWGHPADPSPCDRNESHVVGLPHRAGASPSRAAVSIITHWTRFCACPHAHESLCPHRLGTSTPWT
jgi:hypothetical protein